MKEKTKFEALASIDCSAHIDKKESGGTTLSYLSWAWAWDYFKKEYPDAQYVIKEWDGKPYLFDEKTGYMVETSITAGGETYTMWLPVMDGGNRAMLDRPYQVKTKFKTIDVAAATMFDINKAIMRCLVKNMAMFGLGLYIYAGEDLPAESDGVVEKPAQPAKPTRQTQPVQPFNDFVPEFLKDAPDAHPDDWLTINAFQGICDRARTIDEIQRVLNSQKGNPNLNALVEIASARKQQLLQDMQLLGAVEAVNE